MLPDAPRLAQRSPSIAVYASAPVARCIPLASVTGIEPVGHWALEARPFPELTPMILFSGLPAGESDPGVGGRTPFAGLVPAVLEVHAPSRQDKVKGVITSSPSSRFLQAPHVRH